MSLELTEDRRGGKRDERSTAFGLEALHRLDERERRDLDEILERLVPVAIARRETTRQRQIPLDQLVSRGRIVRATLPQLVIR